MNGRESRLLDGRLKIRHLVLVQTLTQHQSIVAAANALHVTQPVLTRRLRELEEILGVTLFERTSRGVTPTEFGAAFVEHSCAVLAQISQAARHLDEIADARRGRVIVGSHLVGANLLVPRAIAAFKAQSPLVTVVTREGTPESLLLELESGQVDLIVGRLTSPPPAGMTQRHLYHEPITAVVGAQHALAGRAAVRSEDLSEHPWILPGPETVLRRELEEYFLSRRISVPQNVVESTAFLTVRQLLIDGDFVAFLPTLIAQEDERLTVLDIGLAGIRQTVGATMSTGRRLNPASLAFIFCLVRAAGPLEAARRVHDTRTAEAVERISP
ncbi:pca operon transcription factor PcaQ [Pseudonocardia yunnanensis]|uniref:LysR substrate-binding domain-containing protein n=1 Tax=Pseudonocardia yunnanensis TaxID=58107 RepID=A0ABW4FAH2_9PSEU